MIRVREPLDPRISMWHFLAYYLRFERERQGLSLTQWGQIIGAARSTVSNMEAGRIKLHDDQARTLDAKFDTGLLFQLLLWYARIAHNPEWFRQFANYEAKARVIKIYQSQVIPTPLQTEGYARALLSASRVEDVDTAVEARMKRQNEILDRGRPPFVWLLLEIGALEHQVGGPEVMEDQLRHLLKLGELPHVSIRLIPKSAGAHPGFDGPFRIICLESRDVAYAGAQQGGRLIEATGEVQELGVNYDLIGMKATSEEASRDLIQRLMEAPG